MSRMTVGLHQLPTRHGEHILAVVETPRGSLVKYDYAQDLGAMVVRRGLPVGVVYPCDFGFIPSTRAADGDPLDAFILAGSGSYPGVVHHCRILGVILLDQAGSGGRIRNDRIVLAPIHEERYAHGDPESHLSEAMREGLEHFCVDAALLTDKDPRVLGWKGPAVATKLIVAAERATAEAAPAG